MTQEAATRVHRAVRRVLMFLMSLITMVFWLPFARALIEDDTYEWGLFGWGGAGVNEYFVVPTAGVALALALRWIGQRGAGRAASWTMIGFFGVLFAVATLFAIANPDALVVRGDTLGMRLSLAWIGPLLFGGAALVAVWWSRRADRVAAVSGWSRVNLVFLAVVVSLLAASVAFLLHGEQHGASDGYGVRALGWAWLLLDGALIRRGSSTLPPTL